MSGLGLVPCPLCGGRSGYRLHEGNTYRWWAVHCHECQEQVAECRSDRRTDMGRALPKVWPAADSAWNEAGKHAESLRECIRQLAQTNAWVSFGECRGWSEKAILSPHDAEELARRALYGSTAPPAREPKT